MRTLAMGCVIGWMLFCWGCPATTSQGGGAVADVSEEEQASEPALTGDQLEEIKRTVRVGKDALISCYEQEMMRQGKKISCKIMVKLLITASGAAEQVEIGESNIRSPEFDNCVIQSVRTWEFPKLTRATSYSFPYSFSPAY